MRRHEKTSLSHPRAALLLLVLFLACWCTGASALDRETTLRSLRHTAWGPDDGTPDNIAGLIQTEDGYLLACNGEEFVRFDGLSFEPVDMQREYGLAPRAIYALYAPPTGGFWLGYTLGGAAFVKDGNATSYGVEDGLPPNSAMAFAQESDGTIWLSTTNGLYRFDGSRWRPVGPDSGLGNLVIESMLFDSVGTLWAVSHHAVMYLPKGERTFLDAHAKGNDFDGIAESQTGDIWLLSNRWLGRLRSNKTTREKPISSGSSLFFDSDGSLWAFSSDNNGIMRFTQPELIPDSGIDPGEPASDTFSVADGLSSPVSINKHLEDREGNVWITTGQGIDRFSNARVLREGVPEIRGQFSHAAFAPGKDGAIWIGYRDGPSRGINSFKDGLFAESHGIGLTTALLSQGDGTLWSAGSGALWRVSSSGPTRLDLPAQLGSPAEVQAIAEDGQGSVWISVPGRESATWHLQNDAWEKFGGLASLPKGAAITLAMDSEHRVWFGYPEGQVALLDEGVVRLFQGKDQLPIGNITAIYGKRGRVWVGGRSGLMLFDGVGFQPVMAQDGLAIEHVTGIIETNDGGLWLNSGKGIIHFPPSQTRLAGQAQGTPLQADVFNTLDGVRGSPSRLRPLPTAIEAADGKLWFLTSAGFYTVSPGREFRTNSVPPPIFIRSLVANGNTYPASSEMELPARSTAFSISYVGLSLTIAERVNYRYRLKGIDADWQDVGNRRQAFYTNLGPGEYLFEVTASNNDGVWSETPARLSLIIPPTFTQTRWFLAICVMLVVTLAILTMRLRLSQLSRKLRSHFHERLVERERIARELHDTLLQGTQGLILSLHAVASDDSIGAGHRERLNKALERAEEAVNEGRDRINDLRDQSIQQQDIAVSIGDCGRELFSSSAVDFRMNVEGRPRSLGPNTKDAAHHICREALRNAFNHANATSVVATIAYGDDELHVAILDDGLGLRQGNAKPGPRKGHWGLTGMLERSKQLGATLEITSPVTADGGTRIDLRVPASIAYLTGATRNIWWKRRVD